MKERAEELIYFLTPFMEENFNKSREILQDKIVCNASEIWNDLKSVIHKVLESTDELQKQNRKGSILMENGGKEEVDKELKNDMITGNYCSMDEFEGLDYYLFCSTQLHEYFPTQPQLLLGNFAIRKDGTIIAEIYNRDTKEMEHIYLAFECGRIIKKELLTCQ